MSDSGAPAFENIDELLTEKITRHSRHHSDSTSSRNHTPPLPETPETSSQSHGKEQRSPSAISLILIAICILVAFSLIYRPTPAASSK